MQFRVIIPVRLHAKRLPNKPLLDIAGKPMIQHVYENAVKSGACSVVIATDSMDIVEVCQTFGAAVCMTSADHKSGTERLAEAVEALGYDSDDIVVNVQGDEPLVDPNDIDDVIKFHKKNNNFDIVLPIKTTQNAEDKSLIKVVCSKQNKILYFSRAQIPFNFKQKNIKYFKDLSVISFKPQALKKFSKLEPGKLEVIEGIELLRALENDLSIGTFEAKSSSFGVNVKQDLLRAINEMPRNKIRKLY